MRIEFRQHAKDRLRQRGITERQVREVLDAPASAAYDPDQVSVRLKGVGEGAMATGVRYRDRQECSVEGAS
jgi:hypothetical protein